MSKTKFNCQCCQPQSDISLTHGHVCLYNTADEKEKYNKYDLKNSITFVFEKKITAYNKN